MSRAIRIEMGTRTALEAEALCWVDASGGEDLGL